jgi:hypothetical protein
MIVRPSFERRLNERSPMDEWLSYAQAAERLNTTVEAVRLRALRGRWQKTIGNDKRPRIRLPDGWSNDGRTANERRERKPRNDGRTAVERAVDPALVTALEGHVQTLKEQLAAAETRIDKQADDLVGYDTAYAAGLSAERAKVEKLATELSELGAQHAADLAAERTKVEAERARIEKAITQGLAMVKAEQAQTEKAIATFASLAERLDALAAARSRPWWRRLAG